MAFIPTAEKVLAPTLAPQVTTSRRTTVRDAVPGDIPSIVAMGLEFIKSSEYREHIQPDPNKIGELAENLISVPDGTIMILEQDGALRGLIGMLIYSHPLTGHRVAGEIAWWVAPESRGKGGLKLLRRAEQWARKSGAKSMHMIAPNERVAGFYRRVGYEHIESNYQLNLTGQI